MFAKRYVTSPPPVSLIDPETDQLVMELDPSTGRPTSDPPRPIQPITLLDLVKRCLLADPRLSDDYASLCACVRVKDALAASVDGLVVFEEDDWAMLCRVIDFPERFENGQRRRGYPYYNPLLMLQLKPLLDAIKFAPSERAG